jgi:hypothetical protein
MDRDRWRGTVLAALAVVVSVLAGAVHGWAVYCASLIAGSLAGAAAHAALPLKKTRLISD